MKRGTWVGNKGEIEIDIYDKVYNPKYGYRYRVAKTTAQSMATFLVNPHKITIIPCPFCGAEDIHIVNGTTVCENCCKLRG